MAAQEQERERVVPRGELFPERAAPGPWWLPRGAAGRSRSATRRPGAVTRRSASHDRGSSGMPSSGPLQRPRRATPPAPRPHRRRTARGAVRARRGPAARARAAGPRRGACRPSTGRTVLPRRRRPPAPSLRCRSSASGASPAWPAGLGRGRGRPAAACRAVGMICQDRPYRSLSHPHWLSSPPSVSAFQK